MWCWISRILRCNVLATIVASYGHCAILLNICIIVLCAGKHSVFNFVGYIFLKEQSGMMFSDAPVSSSSSSSSSSIVYHRIRSNR